MNKYLKINFLVGVFLLFFIGLTSQSFAVWDHSLKYGDFYKNQETQNLEVSFVVYQTNEFFGEGKLELEVFLNGKEHTTCQEDIKLEVTKPNVEFICEIGKIKKGDLTLVGRLYQNGEVIAEVAKKEYVFENEGVQVNYIEMENYTILEIFVNTNVSTRIVQEIPKSVIEKVTPENKDEVLVSNLEYVIVEEDPVIAWHIDSPPEKINYTINKRLTPEQKAQMRLEAEENKTSYKWMIYIGVFLILIIMFSPAILKKKKKQSN